MINFSQLKQMLEMQDKMNKTINPDWANLEWDFMRASCLESAEAVDHHGWKWWKFQECDLPQLQMEIIDVWHFYLSRYLQLSKGDIEVAYSFIQAAWDTTKDLPVSFDGQNYNLENLSILQKLDLVIGLSAAKRINLNLFFSLATSCELTWNDLFRQYVMKNMLNIFRQKYGYKEEGKYLKEWFGKEDNYFLVEEANKLDSTKDDFSTTLWDRLEALYQEALTEAGWVIK